MNRGRTNHRHLALIRENRDPEGSIMPYPRFNPKDSLMDRIRRETLFALICALVAFVLGFVAGMAGVWP